MTSTNKTVLIVDDVKEMRELLAAHVENLDVETAQVGSESSMLSYLKSDKRKPDLVISGFGQNKWDEIKIKAGLTSDDFSSMAPYSDSITYALVGAASEVLQLPATVILQEFGKHWIKFTAKEGCGVMMAMFGSNFFEAISSINNLHQRIGLSMPQLSAPRFNIQTIFETELLVEYIATRKGLGHMMNGLLYCPAEKNNEKIEIKHYAPGERAEHESFLVKKVA